MSLRANFWRIQQSLVEVPQLGYSLKGMHKSAQGCAATHYPGKRSGPFVPSLKGMNTPGHWVSIPFREWEGG